MSAAAGRREADGWDSEVLLTLSSSRKQLQQLQLPEKLPEPLVCLHPHNPNLRILTDLGDIHSCFKHLHHYTANHTVKGYKLPTWKEVL